MTVRPYSLATKVLIRAIGDTIALSRGSDRLCVVNYHRILPRHDPLLESEPDLATFQWQMALLADCFNVLPLQAALAALDAGTLPPRAVCITFDDGYRSVHDLALPVLRDFDLPATVFVTSGFVGEGSMWNDRIIEVVQSLSEDTLDLSDYGLGRLALGTLQARKQTLNRLTEHSKYLPPQARKALVEKLGAMVSGELDPGLMLTPNMILNLQDSGIEIGAHTVTHPILTCLDDETARLEIAVGKANLEKIVKRPVRLFAYPNGKPGMDFDGRHTAMVRAAGFEAAFTTLPGAIKGGHDRFQLARGRPWDTTPLMFGLRLLRWLAA